MPQNSISRKPNPMVEFQFNILAAFYWSPTQECTLQMTKANTLVRSSYLFFRNAHSGCRWRLLWWEVYIDNFSHTLAFRLDCGVGKVWGIACFLVENDLLDAWVQILLILLLQEHTTNIKSTTRETQALATGSSGTWFASELGESWWASSPGGSWTAWSSTSTTRSTRTRCRSTPSGCARNRTMEFLSGSLLTRPLLIGTHPPHLSPTGKQDCFIIITVRWSSSQAGQRYPSIQSVPTFRFDCSKLL